eukprot:CAMPEP_0174358770 /NCGR_PEP_ID=MMETSP0811_2-20130205/44599_1 /TAXON_ID=73025 ORGANISM="Eutreptiella gymnastica-like, Strain CCMP1594" /NCGR_SAMPLE_ID=MMETSP0811_2 /ASSEMBLY_ACC=CAM_ASM_000667 /LENGTH=112 /DNA_ID=CAMNT_0015492833 /DNA_START=22 /DNA_END=357 /DNA_ORIENTATION=+
MPESSKRQIFSFGESQLKERGAIVKKYIEAYTGTCEAGACNAEDAEKTVKAVEDDVIASFGVRLDTKSQDVVRGLVRCWWNEVRQSRQQAWVAHTKHADVDGEGQGVEHEME